MAAKEKSEFEKNFEEGAPAKPAVSENQAFGISDGPDDASEGDDSDAGKPAAVVIVADGAPAGGAPADAAGEAASNQSAAASAKGATDEANAKAATGAHAPSTGSQEAAGGAPEGSPAEEAAETPAQEAKEMSAEGLDDLSDVPPEDLQKAKSWVGRLRKIEADLKAKGDASAAQAAPVAEALEKGSLEKLESHDESGAQQLDDMADQVASGEISVDEAMKSLAEDFGEPFVKMIQAVASAAAGKTADEKMEPVGKNVKDVIDHLNNEAARKHFEEIHGAHPDFQDVTKDPGFDAFVAAKGAQKIVESGNAKEINQLLAEYKASKPAAAAPDAAAAEGSPAEEAQETPAQESAEDQSAADNAEGVRSSGMHLPAHPKRGSDDYAEAWNEF